MLSGTKVLLVVLSLAAFLPAQETYWPVGQWRTASPESQGLDSRALAAIVERVSEKQLGVHSLLVIRHGYLVLDAYFYPYDPSSIHDLASVTKSLTSLLTGIAVNRGIVKLSQPVLPLFPNERPVVSTKQKDDMTVENLLRMESGLDCGYKPGEQELEQMKRSDNWVRYALALPMKYDPGTHPAYCSPGYHLLGSVIASAAHSTELEFARTFLFEPLGIRDVVWSDDPQGRTHGWGDSHFFPRDLAKIGYLYLHGGRWGEKQIVSEDWVKMSTALPSVDRSAHGGMGYEWNVTKGTHGLQYGGIGRGGQTLLIWPELDLIVVSMAGGNNGQIAQAVPDAVKANAALPENSQAKADLAAKVANAAKVPAADTVERLPLMAAKISGRTYDFPINPSRLDSLRLTFVNATSSHVTVRYMGQELTLPLGLNGDYRLGPNGPLHLLAGAKGRWTAPNEFLLDLNFIANINHYTMQLRFEDDQVTTTVNEASGLSRNQVIVGKVKLTAR